MEITVETAVQLRLTPDEFKLIIQKLGRTPNFTELCAFSGMWSEHCSYKNSIKLLKTLPRDGEKMLVKAGDENAGLMDIGDGYGVVFKIESHNHPSAIEPFQGAATGVGGINSLFFNFVSFISIFLLYKVFVNVYPNKKWQVIIGCFLLPSTLYFSSGIHKDLIVLMALSVFCYSLFFGLMKGFTGKKIIYLLLSFATILFIRNFIAVILLPCAITWGMAYKYRLSAIKTFAALFVAGIACTILLQQISLKINPLLIVVKKQQAFFALGKANTDYKMDSLQPTIKSFAEQAPAALRHSFLSPYPNEFSNFYMNLFSLEMVAYCLLFVLMLSFPAKIKYSNKDFIVFGVTFTFLIFLFTGYITPAAGALIRYRSIYFPFIIIPILCNINWKELFDKLRFFKTKTKPLKHI